MHEGIPIPGAKGTIRTAILADEAAALRELARGEVVLELGSQYGFSTVLMAAVAERVHAVDWHRGDDAVGHRESLSVLWDNLERFGVRDDVVLHVGANADVLGMMAPGSFGFAFHDSGHEEASVRADVAMMLPLMRPGSLIAFHDFGRYGVAAAVKATGLERVSLTSTLAVVRVPGHGGG
jgi:predicted O-methyltransferase YrrM